MADNHETPDNKNRFTGFINVAGFPKKGHFLFAEEVGRLGSKFTVESPVLEGGCDDPADPHTYVEPSTRYEIASKYGSQVTIAAFIRAGLLPEDFTTETEELRGILQEIEDQSNDGMGGKGA